MSDDEAFVIDEELAQAEVTAIAARVHTGDNPHHRTAELLIETRSPAYVRIIAARVSATVTGVILNDPAVPATLGVIIAGRLAQFLHSTRIGLQAFDGIQNQ